MKNFFEAIGNLRNAGECFAYAIVIETEGSTPRKVGAKMIILKEGKTIGTLGGSELEKRVIEEALDAIGRREPRIVSFTLDIEKGKLDMMCGGKLEVYIEPVLPDDKLIIFGAGHISRALAPLMQMAGFLVSIIDDSPDLLQEDKFPEIENLTLKDMEKAAKELSPDPNTYIVLLSRGFSKDKAILSQLIQKDIKYIGMIGSTRKIETIKEDLKKQGVTEQAFLKLRAPVGLDIGAETPEEIAISIAAEIIAAKKGKIERLRKA